MGGRGRSDARLGRYRWTRWLWILPLVLSSCEWATERSLTGRALLWLDADMADIDRFPARSIGRGDGPVFEFSVVGDDASSGDRYDSAFRPLVLRTEAGPDTVPFEEFLERWDTWSFLVMRRDTLLGEWYFAGKAGDKVETTFSASKSLLSAAVGVALKEGFVDGVDDPITRYVPELAARDPRFEGLTLRHLLTMSSGIGFSRGKGPWGDEARSYYHPDLRSVALSRDLVRDPGETFQYNFYNPLLIGLALERASGISVSQMIEDGFWSRIGAEEDASWSLDSRRHGFEKMESGFNAAPRDLLRFGRLMLNRGSWDGEELLPPEWVDVSTAADSIGDPNLEYAYMWWVNPVENRPPDFYAAGRFGQYVYVVPDLEMVMVRTGSSEGDVGWPSLFELVANRVAAVASVAGTETPAPPLSGRETATRPLSNPP